MGKKAARQAETTDVRRGTGEREEPRVGSRVHSVALRDPLFSVRHCH